MQKNNLHLLLLFYGNGTIIQLDKTNFSAIKEKTEMIVFLIEAIVLCALFTITIMASMKNPLNQIYSYPPNIVARVAELGLIEEIKTSSRLEAIKKKWPAMILFGAIIGVFVYFVNDADSFVKAFGVSYGLWLFVDWYASCCRRGKEKWSRVQ